MDGGSLLGVLGGAFVTLQVMQDGEWVNVSETRDANLIDLLGLFGDEMRVEAHDLPAGQYRVVYGGNGLASLVQQADWSMTLDRTSLVEFDVTNVEPASGNLLTDPGPGGSPDDLGPDDAAVLQVKNADGDYVTPDAAGTVIAGLYGTLTVMPDGSYTYQPNADNAANVGKVDVFDYKLVHPNGSEDEAKLYVRLDSDQVELEWDDANPGQDAVVTPAAADSGDASVIVENTVEQVDQADVIEYSWALGALGIVLGNTSGTHVFTVEEGTTSSVDLDITGSGLASLLNGLKFTLESKDEGGNWVKVGGSEAGGLIDLIGLLPTRITAHIDDLQPGEYRLIVENASAITLPGSVSVDMTQHVTHYDQVSVGGVTPAEGNVLEASGIDTSVDGPVAVSVKDGATVKFPGVDPVVLEGDYGTLTMNADGSWTYEPKADINAIEQADVFTYQLHFANGQVSEGTITVNIGETNNTQPAPGSESGDELIVAHSVPLDGLDDDGDDADDDQGDEDDVALEDVLKPEADPVESYLAGESSEGPAIASASTETEPSVIASAYTEDPEDQAWSQHDVSGI
nr:BapA/Bap/LapF family large adhesin [uncultured Pigmentiphaga sp.]